MKVREPGNSLFLWNMMDLSIKPNQEIVLTQPIVQWQFVRRDLLAILTSSELRVYIRDTEGQFNLYHFYLIKGKQFCWVEFPLTDRDNRLSINSIVVMQCKGVAKVIELYGLEKKGLHS